MESKRKQQTHRYTIGNRLALTLQTWSDSTNVMAEKNPKNATVRKTSWPLSPGCRNGFPRARRAITHMIRHSMYPTRIQNDMKIGWG